MECNLWTTSNYISVFKADTKEFFRFQIGHQRYEIPLSSLNISGWKLDLLVDIFNGRYSVENSY
jgi:hypothetical protein